MPSCVARAVSVGEFIASPDTGRALRRHRLGQTEVEHFDRAVVTQLDIRGLEIAVDDAVLVRGLERLGDLPGDGHQFRPGHRLPRKLRQIRALHELHRDVRVLGDPAP